MKKKFKNLLSNISYIMNNNIVMIFGLKFIYDI